MGLDLRPLLRDREPAWGAWSALGPIVAERDLGGAAAWGAILAAVGVGALAGSLLAARVKPRRPLLFAALADGVFALPLAFLAAAPPVPLIAGGALLSGAGMALAISVWESTLQRHVPGESLSRVSSYDWFGSLAFYPLGLAIWGPVAAVIGVSVSLWLAFGLAIATTLTLLSVPDIRHLPAAAPPARRRRRVQPEVRDCGANFANQGGAIPTRPRQPIHRRAQSPGASLSGDQRRLSACRSHIKWKLDSEPPHCVDDRVDLRVVRPDSSSTTRG